MDELLKKLLEAEILTEDTKQELESEFKRQLSEAVRVAKSEAQAKITAELNEQWINERELLIEAIDTKVSEVLSSEISEFKQDVQRFRDLEAEYAMKIVEEKERMSKVLKKDISQLVEKLDSFLEIRLNSELRELREDIQEAKRDNFGRNVFEAFVAEFKKHYTDDQSTQRKLDETQQRLAEALDALESAERKQAQLQRNIKMEKLLTPLSGRTKEVMEAILKNVDTALLEDAYQTYIGRVLKETVSTTDHKPSERSRTVLTEGQKKVTGKIKNGDDKDRIVAESAYVVQDQKHTIGDTELTRLRKVAGIN